MDVNRELRNIIQDYKEDGIELSAKEIKEIRAELMEEFKYNKLISRKDFE